MLKLFKLNEMEDGTIRLQSQMSVGKTTADFVLKDGILYVWTGNSFDISDIDYVIVTDIEEMRTQQL